MFKTWSLALREEHVRRVLRRIFRPRRDEVTAGWRKLNNKELHNLYFSPSIIRTVKSMRWAGHIARMGRRGVHIGYWLAGRMGLDNIKMDLGEIEWGSMD
jgi:hypothetical protein